MCLARTPGDREGRNKAILGQGCGCVTSTVRTLVAGRVLNRGLLAPKQSLVSAVLFGKDLGVAMSIWP